MDIEAYREEQRREVIELSIRAWDPVFAKLRAAVPAYIPAVDPAYPRRGIAKALLDHAFVVIREAGMRMVMVETGDDSGHAPSRATYESVGFERWPVARYSRTWPTATGPSIWWRWWRSD